MERVIILEDNSTKQFDSKLRLEITEIMSTCMHAWILAGMIAFNSAGHIYIV